MVIKTEEITESEQVKLEEQNIKEVQPSKGPIKLKVRLLHFIDCKRKW